MIKALRGRPKRTIDGKILDANLITFTGRLQLGGKSYQVELYEILNSKTQWQYICMFNFHSTVYSIDSVYSSTKQDGIKRLKELKAKYDAILDNNI